MLRVNLTRPFISGVGFVRRYDPLVKVNDVPRGYLHLCLYLSQVCLSLVGFFFGNN
jgi:hypothetical protein